MASYCDICRQDFDTSPPACGCKTVAVELTGDEAAALAQFLKRLLLDDFTGKCEPRDTRPTATREAMQYTMQRAADKVARSLAKVGHAPR